MARAERLWHRRLENRIWGPIGGSVCLFLSFVVLELFLLVNRNGQTLGKGLLRIKVIRTDERPLTVLNSSARLLVLFGVNWFWHPINVLLLLGNMLAVTADRKVRRAAHDYAARTRVVMADRRPIKFADVKLMAPKVNRSKRLLTLSAQGTVVSNRARSSDTAGAVLTHLVGPRPRRSPPRVDGRPLPSVESLPGFMRAAALAGP